MIQILLTETNPPPLLCQGNSRDLAVWSYLLVYDAEKSWSETYKLITYENSS